MPSLNKVFGKLKPGVLKAWSVNIKTKKIIYGYNNKYSLNGIFNILKILLLTPISARARNAGYRKICKYLRVFIAKIRFNIIKLYLD